MNSLRSAMYRWMPTFSTAYRDSGVVERNLFAYITPGILITLAGIVTIAGISWDQLLINFNTNVALNGLIMTILGVAILSSLWFNFRLWQTANFIAELDSTVKSGECSEERRDYLYGILNNQARVMDTKNTVNLLDNLVTYGHLNVTDNDARLIKSKLGFRVSKSRTKVGFLSGLLVMLGLLGTFWGLLATIDAVGDAMGSMASIGSGGGSEDSADGGMSDFIAGIAAPLKGMGIAFSSSLFGLAGSLLSGFFNYLCGGVHDRFMETTSRWIDERIPKPDAKMKKAAADPKVSGSDELKAWLAGFVQTSQITQRKIGELITSLQQSSETTLLAAKNTEEILNRQDTMSEALSSMSTSLTQIESQNTKLCDVLTEERAEQLLTSNANVLEQLASANTELRSITEVNEAVADDVSKMNDSIDTLKAAVIEEWPAELNEAYNTMGRMVEQIDNNLADLEEKIDGEPINLEVATQPVTHAIQVIDSRLQVVTGTIEDQLAELLSETKQPKVPTELSELLSGVVDALNSNHQVQGNVFDQLGEVAQLQKELLTATETSNASEAYYTAPNTLLDVEPSNDESASANDDSNSQTGAA